MFFDHGAVCEALVTRGVVIRPWKERLEDFDRTGTAWAVYRAEGVTSAQRVRMRVRCQELRGMGYSKAELALQAADELLGRWLKRAEAPIRFRVLGEILPRRMICSKVAGIVGRAGGLMPWEARWWNPDHAHDFVVAQGWRLVVEDGSGWFTRPAAGGGAKG